MMHQRKLIINTKNNETVTLNEPYTNVESIKINSLSLCNSFFNFTDKNNYFGFLDGTNVNRNNPIPNGWLRIVIPPGLYNVETFSKEFGKQLRGKGLSNESIKLKVVEANGKIEIKIKNVNNAFRLFRHHCDMFGINFPVRNDVNETEDSFKIKTRRGDKPANFSTFSHFEVYCDILKSDFTSYNGKRTDLLCLLPLKGESFGTLVNYDLSDSEFIPCKKEFNSINICIKDNWGNIIDFNGFPIICEFILKLNRE